MNDIVKRATDAQKQASNPDISVWVSAHAGSGKTTVLSRRVMRLLLNKNNPGSILCLTFTRSAAANMANRVYNQLRSWVKMSDDDLKIELIKTHGHANDLDAARRLFAQSLETPGGLKVQTIHAFCGRILRQFPLEAGVSADFAELDDEMAQTLLTRAKQAVFLEARRNVDLKAALVHLSQSAGDFAIDELLNESLKFKKLFVENTATQLQNQLRKKLNITRLQSELEADIYGKTVFKNMKTALDDLRPIVTAVSDKNFFDNLALVIENSEKYRENYLQLFFTKAFEPRKKIITIPIGKKLPHLEEALKFEAERIYALIDEINRAKAYENSAALMVLSTAIVKKYEFYKKQGGYLDFDDLVNFTAMLLSNEGAAWVLYKLDAEIDHILVDEAQDTSPEQWQIIENLVSVFLGGESSRGNKKRTLFVVGDEKQSIFSFQGADPQKFDEMRQHFTKGFEESGLDFESIPLKTSFRSSATILDFVDKISNLASVKQGLVPQNAILENHEAGKPELTGMVELWGLEKKLEESEPDWQAPVDKQPSNIELLARKIALQIKKWLDSGENITVSEGGKTTSRPIEAGDILILSKNRDALYSEILKALKTHHIPVAGADRLNLNNHIAIEDCINLGESLSNLEDDLKLANLLKSPFIDMSEEALFALAHARKASLWQELRQKNMDIAKKIQNWRDLSQTHTPAQFYQHLFTTQGYRKKYQARFGREAEELLDVFLQEAENDVENGNLPLLLPFVTTMKAKNREIKRDLELTRNEVRVMTVHGAKGLEANIVFIANATQGVRGNAKKRIYTLDNLPIWAGSGNKITEIETEKEAIKANETAEYQRLLYVALTRAASRLIICGLEKRAKDHWYSTISGLMQQEANEIVGEGEIYRWYNEKPELTFSNHETIIIVNKILPEFLKNIQELKKSTDFSRKFEISEKVNRGILVHKLLQYLPAIESEKQRKIASEFITKNVKDANEQAEILTSVFNCLENEELKPFFGQNSKAEVEISNAPQTIRLDRLFIDKETIWFIDYKSTQNVPHTINDINESIITQMQGYFERLCEIYPLKTVKCKLIYTHTMRHFTLDETHLKP